MLRVALQRIASSLATLALVSIAIFLAVEALPGDACTAYLKRDAQGQRLDNCRRDFGLETPAVARWMAWASGFVQGDLGVSMKRKKPIAEVVGWRFRNTVVLAATASLVGIPLALALGVLAGLSRDRTLDVVLSSTAIFAMTIPDFVSSTVLILIFAVGLGWTNGVVTVNANAPILELVSNTVLPTAALMLVMVAHILRLVRTSVIDVLESDFVTMARLKGVPFRRIVWRHVLPNSLLPSISLIGLTIAWLLGGVVVTETVFNYPGIGRLSVDAVSDRDLPLVQTIALLLAGVYIGVNLVADLLSLALNPRLRTYRA